MSDPIIIDPNKPILPPISPVGPGFGGPIIAPEQQAPAAVMGEQIANRSRRYNLLVAKWLPQWMKHAFTNFGGIHVDFESHNSCLTAHPDKSKTPVIIIGSGPSLDKYAPLLKDWRGLVMCAPSNAKIPARWGRRPDYMCAYDSKPDVVYNQMKGCNWSGTALITHPCVDPQILRFWKWQKYYYLMRSPGIDFLEYVLPTQGIYDMIKVRLLNAGCTTNNAIEICDFLQLGPIFLLGCDMGYPGDVGRCTNWEIKDGSWKEIPPHGLPPLNILQKASNGVWTTEEFIDYKLGLFSVIYMDVPQVYDCSEGIVTELPKADFKDVVKWQGRIGDYPWTREQIRENVRKYIESHGIATQPTEAQNQALVEAELKHINEVERDKEYHEMQADIAEMARRGEPSGA